MTLDNSALATAVSARPYPAARSAFRQRDERVIIREADPADAEACGRIIHEAFSDIAARHGFPPDCTSSLSEKSTSPNKNNIGVNFGHGKKIRNR